MAHFPPGEGGGPNPAYQEDFLQRIVAVHWPKKVIPGFVQQALVGWRSGPNWGAIALDSGDAFDGIQSGASGFIGNELVTVMTAGIVVYGVPRDGEACFMLCRDGTTIERGVAGEEGNLVWEEVHSVSGDMFSLSFAGEAFIIVYQLEGSRVAASVISYDGTNWDDFGSLYSYTPDPGFHEWIYAGNVAFNGSTYASVGMLAGDPNYPDISSDSHRMIWNDGHTAREDETPGILADSIGFINESGVAYETIAGGNGVFVAVACTKASFLEFPGYPFPPYNTQKIVRSTAAAAISSDGASWNFSELPGVLPGSWVGTAFSGWTYQSRSYAGCVAFIGGGTSGYFVMTALSSEQSSGRPEQNTGHIHRGDASGGSWELVRSSSDKFYVYVSPIARELNLDTIIFV